MRAVQDFGGGRRGGKTLRAENSMRATLLAGGRVLYCDGDGQFNMSLAEDGFTLVRTPVPLAETSPIWIDEMTDADLGNARTDHDFEDRLARWTAHMERFKAAHQGQTHGELLVELERTERWTAIMGDYAVVMAAPSV